MHRWRINGFRGLWSLFRFQIVHLDFKVIRRLFSIYLLRLSLWHLSNAIVSQMSEKNKTWSIPSCLLYPLASVSRLDSTSSSSISWWFNISSTSTNASGPSELLNLRNTYAGRSITEVYSVWSRRALMIVLWRASAITGTKHVDYINRRTGLAITASGPG